MAIVQISQITQRKGLAENLPQLAGAEFGWSTDTRQLWIGNGTLAEGAPVVGNTEILTEFSDILNFNTTYTYKGQAAGYTVQTGPTPGDPVTQSLQSWLDQFASVKDFGAVGDGTTDDTDAINRALYQLYCREVNPQIRRSLFFPAGVYRVTDSILIPPFATLYGEGPDNSVIQLDAASGASYVAQTADSLQQTGVNIGNGGALTPQYVTINNLGFASLDASASIFLVEDVVNFRFSNVLFKGPLTTTDLATASAGTVGLGFASTSSLICNQIVVDDCQFTGTTWAINTNQQVTGATITNSKLYTLYQGVVLGTGSLSNGGPNGFRITGNLLDAIFAEGIVIGAVSLNATGHNIFYDVGNHFGGTTTPYTACIDIQSSNNISISDLFQRSDVYSNTVNPGTSYPRITLNNTQSIASTNGEQLALGTYTRISGTTATLSDNTASPTLIFSENNLTTVAFTVNYTIIRSTSSRSGSMTVVNTGGGLLNFSDDYVENQTTGITLSANQVGNTINVNYTSTSTGSSADFIYSVNYLA